MADRDAVRATWEAAGTEEVMLPSGMEVGLVLPTLAELVRSGAFSGQLRAAVMRAAPSASTEEEQERRDLTIRELIVRAVRKVRAPAQAAEPDGRWQDWKARHLGVLLRRWPVRTRRVLGAWQPHQLTAEDVDPAEPRIPPVDLEALTRLVLHAQSPAQVDTVSRLAHDLIDREEAQAILDRERDRGLDAWRPFRPERPGMVDGALSEDLGHGSRPDAGDLGSGRGLRGQRGAGAAPAPSAAPGQAR